LKLQRFLRLDDLAAPIISKSHTGWFRRFFFRSFKRQINMFSTRLYLLVVPVDAKFFGISLPRMSSPELPPFIFSFVGFFFSG